MAIRTEHKTKSTTTMMAELALAVPQVVAHRVTRMAMAGPSPSARDRKEFSCMIAEKNTAFAQSWQAMFAQSLRANQALAATFFSPMWGFVPSGRASVGETVAKFGNAAIGISEKGLSPIHRKAVANAKRLAKTKLR